MKHAIDPTVDCVFKAILGSNDHINLLLNFVNSVCQSDFISPITKLTILNPYNEKEFLSDKMSIVDVKASDDLGNIFQIEIQLFVSSSLKQRMVHNWAEIYSHQLKEGEPWSQLKPVIAIWLICKPVFQNFSGFHSHFCLYDNNNRLKLTEHANIHIIELSKWNKSQVETDLDRWTHFFRDGKNLNNTDIPNDMLTEEMEQAMAILKQFSEKEREYDRYRARINYLRDQKTMEEEREAAKAELKETKKELAKEKLALAEKKQALAEKKQALAEKKQALVEKKQALVEKKQALAEEKQALAEEKRALAEEKKISAEKDCEIENLKRQLQERSTKPEK